MPQPPGWKILVATDGSEGATRAVAAAARLPWPDGSQIRLITVVETRSELPETIAAHRRRAGAALDRARASLTTAGRAVSVAALDGAPARTILADAQQWGATVIVVGSRGLGAAGGMVLGSVSSAVARAAQSSVVVIKRDLATLKLLVAVDESEHGRTAARKLAELPGKGAAVTILRVIEPPFVKSLRLLPSSAAERIRAEIARATNELEQEAKTQVEQLAGLFKRAGWKADFAVRAGVPAREIKAMAAKTRATLVGVGARGATGLERVLVGSVSEALLGSTGLSLFIGR